jgi:hypothetical protein
MKVAILVEAVPATAQRRGARQAWFLPPERCVTRAINDASQFSERIIHWRTETGLRHCRLRRIGRLRISGLLVLALHRLTIGIRRTKGWASWESWLPTAQAALELVKIDGLTGLVDRITHETPRTARALRRSAKP